VGRNQPSTRTIVGVFGAVLFGVGLHHLVATGTCSSTGYSSSYGAVPYCPKGTGWWFLFVFGGVITAVIGGLVSGGSSALLIIPTIFTAIGIGSITVAFDSHAAHGSKTFALIFGGAFLAIGLIPALVIGIGWLRGLVRRPTPARPVDGGGGAGVPPVAANAAAVSAFGTVSAQPDAILGAYAASPSMPPASLHPPRAPSPAHPTGDVLDKISKLSELHKSGALTDEEFNREKAKLLAEL
jgi:Short C-terminal domain